MYTHTRRYNRTNFTSTTVAAKIVEAMDKAVTDGLSHYITNRQGQRWLRVCVKPCAEGFTFEFTCENGQEVGDVILQALFVWPDHLEREFSTLLGHLYCQTQHPYQNWRTVVLRETSEALRAKHKESLKALGVTHSFRTDAGVSLLGRWKRSWIFGRTFEVLADAKGYPVDKPYDLSREAVLYGSIQGAFTA